MALDLAPYDAIDDQYEEDEQDTMLLRMLQSAEGGAPVAESDLMVLGAWVRAFQKQRGLIALALKGLVKVRIVDGQPGFEANLCDPLPSLGDMISDRKRRSEGPDDPAEPDAIS